MASSEGGAVTLAGQAGKNVVLYFYPKDDTPGCTLEGQDFTKALPKFRAKNTVVFGVSKDSVESHCKFRDKYGFTFPLLSDPEGKAIQAYGAWGEKNNYGKKYMGIVRSTVIIGADGVVTKVFPKVSVAGHVDAVLAALDGGASAPAKKAAPARKKAAAPTKKATKVAAKKPAAKSAKKAAKKAPAKKKAAPAKKAAAKKKSAKKK